MLDQVTRARQRWVLGAMGALALAAPGCYDGYDPLAPEVLAEVMRSRGDAQGFERSGVYEGSVEPLDCGCTDLDGGLTVSLCTALDDAAAFGLANLQLELVQAEGSVRLRALGLGGFFEAQAPLLPVFYGPLHADGSMSAAGVIEADVLAVQGQVLARIDGTIERDGDEWHLVADYQQRYVVELVVPPDALDVGIAEGEEGRAIDCREHIGLDVRWTAPSPVPVPVGGS